MQPWMRRGSEAIKRSSWFSTPSQGLLPGHPECGDGRACHKQLLQECPTRARWGSGLGNGLTNESQRHCCRSVHFEWFVLCDMAHYHPWKGIHHQVSSFGGSLEAWWRHLSSVQHSTCLSGTTQDLYVLQPRCLPKPSNCRPHNGRVLQKHKPQTFPWPSPNFLTPIIEIQTESGLISKKNSSPLIQPPICMLASLAETSLRLTLTQGDPFCWSAWTDVSLVKPVPHSLSGNSGFCGREQVGLHSSRGLKALAPCRSDKVPILSLGCSSKTTTFWPFWELSSCLEALKGPVDDASVDAELPSNVTLRNTTMKHSNGMGHLNFCQNSLNHYH